MKLSVDRLELTGPFGGTYYETYIRLSMSDEESEAIRNQRLMSAFVVGTNNPENAEAKLAFWVTNKWGITVEDLTFGITGKVSNESQIHHLARFENLIRERCKALKERIDDASSTKEAFRGEIFLTSLQR
jgi:hypothetical protein